MPFNFGELLGQSMARAKSETMADVGAQGGRGVGLATARLTAADPGGGRMLNVSYDADGVLYDGFVVGVNVCGDTI